MIDTIKRTIDHVKYLAMSTNTPGMKPDRERLATLFTLQVRRFNVLYTRASTIIFRRDYGLTLNEWRTLSAVWLHGNPGVTLTQLADEAGFDAGLASRLVASLVDKELLTRASRTQDARFLDLRPTARGDRLARRIFRLSERRNERLLSRLPPVARRSLAISMRALIDEARVMLDDAAARTDGRRRSGARGG